MEHLESFHKRRPDRVGLDHVPHKSQSKNNKYRKQSCESFSERSFERRFDIVDRTSCHLAVYLCLICLCQNCLRIDRRHSEECADPHPEDRTRSASDEGCRRSCEVSGSYLGSDRRGDGLERGHLAFLMLFAVHAEMSEYLADAFPELSDLDES